MAVMDFSGMTCASQRSFPRSWPNFLSGGSVVISGRTGKAFVFRELLLGTLNLVSHC